MSSARRQIGLLDLHAGLAWAYAANRPLALLGGAVEMMVITA